MTPPATTVERLALDAAALVRVASPNDWPHGFVVVPDRLPGNMWGVACGAGGGLAEFYGLRPGVRAVVVDVFKAAGGQVDALNSHAVLSVETSAVHEAAHALTTADTTSERVGELLSTAGVDVPAYTAERVARQHCPRWAMAFWLLVNRAAAYRPRTGAEMVNRAAVELGHYGYPRVDLERLAAGVGTDEPLGKPLVAGGAWQSLLVARLPDESTRAVAIVAAGIVRGE